MAVQVVRKTRNVRSRRRRVEAHAAVAPSKPCFDRDYWVCHSDGFRVDAAQGRVGFVEAVRSDPDEPGSVLLLIRAGTLGRRVLVARPVDVAMIVPRAKRMWLDGQATLRPLLELRVPRGVS